MSRKREVQLQINKSTGEITVLKDAGTDVFLMDLKTGEAKSINPRVAILLERHEDGKIIVREVPENTRIDVTYVEEQTVETPSKPAPEGETKED